MPTPSPLQRVRRPLRGLAVLAAILLARAVGAQETGLHAATLYAGPGRPIPLVAILPDGAMGAEIVLLDHEGTVLAVPRAIGGGPFDLRDALPPAEALLRERGAAAWLQMIVDGEAVGSALVLQPMLSRLVPVTEVREHPTRGQPHTAIIGWALEPEGPEPPTAPEDGAMPTPGQRTFTGLRVYADRDVMLRTDHGDIRVALRPDVAPNTAWNFRHLADGGFYDGTVFHRIVPRTRAGDPFVIQGGDPSATGEGGPGWWLPLEPSDLPHDFGVISMARADDPDSAGSQFFFCLSRAGTARLDGQYCAFGAAVAGGSTILDIAEVELADITRGRPVDPPVIERAELVPAPPRRPGAGRPDRRDKAEAPAPAEAPPSRVPR